jgi:PLP dependent protein
VTEEVFTPATEQRVQELSQRLDAVRARITRATADAGRDTEPELIVVTKFFPASDVVALHTLGVLDVGENREQEAGPKAIEAALHGAHPRWHFIGQLQSNKAARVLRFASEVHSVDRAGLVTALAKAAQRRFDTEPATAPTGIYLQVDLRGEASASEDPNAPRGGARPERLAELAGLVAESGRLRLRGLMAVAPLGEDPRPAFERLAGLSERLRRDHPDARELSAGMSGDLEAAVGAGATRLRIGSDVLGRRSSLL